MGAETYPVLAHSVLSGLVREFVPNPDAMKGKQIFKSKSVLGYTMGIDVITNPRHLARYRHPDAKSKQEKLKAIKHIDVTLPHIKMSKMLPESIFKALRTPGTDHQAYGKQAIVEELEGLDILAENAMEKARWDCLQTGIVSQTASGDVDDVGFSIDFGIDGNHTPTLTGGNLWSAPTTCDPITNIIAWRKTFAENSGVEAKYAFCSTTVMGYLIAADAMQSMMGDRMKDAIFTTGALPGVAGLEKIIVYDGGYVPEGGSFTPYLGVDKVVLWSGNPHKEYVGVFNDRKATAPGKFSKAWEDEDPSGTHILLGVCALPSGERIKEFWCSDVA